MHKKIALLIALIVSLSLSDYGLFLRGQALLATFFFLWLLGSLLVEGKGLTVKGYIPVYVAMMVTLLLLNVMLDGDFNFVVFVPLIAYMVVSLMKAEDRESSLEKLAVSILYLVLIPCAALEIAIKLGFADVASFRELIENTGDRRLDVLRVKSPFGSPLSLASLLFALVFYFANFTKRKLEIGILFVLLIMTGSRTALAASAALVAGRYAIRLFSNGIHMSVNPAKAFAFAIAMGAILVGAVMYLERIGMAVIVDRVLSLKSYDLTADQSFLDRADTSMSTFVELVSELPRSLVFALKEDVVSDSAFVSIAAQSGLLAAILFFGFFYYCAGKLAMGSLNKAMFLALFSLLVVMVGDAVVPLVSFLYFMVFYTHSNERLHQAETTSLEERLKSP